MVIWSRTMFDRYHIVSTNDVTVAMRRLEEASVQNGASLVSKRRRTTREILKGNT